MKVLKKTLKRASALFIALSMTSSCLPVFAFDGGETAEDSGGSYAWFKFIINNSLNTQKQYKVNNIDMSMVGKITFDHNMSDRYTLEDHWYWFNPNYHRGWKMWLKLDGSEVWSSKDAHNWENTEKRLSSSQQKENSSITMGGQTTGKCGNAQFEFGSVSLWYEPVEIQIGPLDDDAMIQRKIYSS